MNCDLQQWCFNFYLAAHTVDVLSISHHHCGVCPLHNRFLKSLTLTFWMWSTFIFSIQKCSRYSFHKWTNVLNRNRGAVTEPPHLLAQLQMPLAQILGDVLQQSGLRHEPSQSLTWIMAFRAGPWAPNFACHSKTFLKFSNMRYQLLIYFALLAYFIKLLFVFFTFSSLSFYTESGRSSVYFL